MLQPSWNLGPALNRIRKKSELLEHAIVEEFARTLVRNTPVDTGTLRGSWDIGLGNASLRREVYYASKRAPADPFGNITVGRISAKARRKRPGQNVSFQNRAIYAEIVELGLGRQPRAALMMRRTVAVWSSIVRRARARVGL